MKYKHYIIIFLLLVSVVSFFFYKKQKKERFGNKLGYAEVDEDYIEPKVIPKFVSKEEADYIIKNAKDKFSKSYVLSGLDAEIRKSETAWLEKDDPVVKKIVKRVCEMGDYPFENAEDLQVVRYGPGGFYKPHHDSCGDDNDDCRNFFKSGGHRLLTVLIYLNDGFEGGETRFENLDMNIKPPKYSAIKFYPLDQMEYQCHPKALHGGNPLKSGTKIIANVWIRERKFTPQPE
jgi:prolyl 4-hydroxylase